MTDTSKFRTPYSMENVGDGVHFNVLDADGRTVYENLQEGTARSIIFMITPQSAQSAPAVPKYLKMHMQEETVVEVDGITVNVWQEDSSRQIGTQYLSFKGVANLDAFIGMLTEARERMV